jgi:hypothetical protein
LTGFAIIKYSNWKYKSYIRYGKRRAGAPPPLATKKSLSCQYAQCYKVEKLSLKKLKKITVIGRGGFGKVIAGLPRCGR